MRTAKDISASASQADLSLFGDRQNVSLPHYDKLTTGQKAAVLLLARDAGLSVHMVYDAGHGNGERDIVGQVSGVLLSHDDDDHFHQRPERLVVFFGELGINAEQIKSIESVDQSRAVELADSRIGGRARSKLRE